MIRSKWTPGLMALALIAALSVPGAVLAQDIYSAPGRAEGESERDAGSKPAEVYAFWGIEPGMTVIDFAPGGGYNTALLAALVGDSGMVYAGPDRQNREGVMVLASRLEANPLSNVTVTGLEGVPAGSVDVVVTVRNFHDVYNGGRTEEALAGMMRALKLGGVLGIVDARTTMEGFDSNSHRINQQTVVDAVTAAGFEFVEASEMLANPDDDFGTWEGASGRTSTDRMVLKFRKGM